jgi:hypothetical protein
LDIREKREERREKREERREKREERRVLLLALLPYRTFRENSHFK